MFIGLNDYTLYEVTSDGVDTIGVPTRLTNVFRSTKPSLLETHQITIGSGLAQAETIKFLFL
jgi:hypothetical protein